MAAEIRARVAAKMKGQPNSGIDPEIMAEGTVLAVYHIEAGTRKFVDFARRMAADLDVTMDQIRPYLRSWYNGARDMLEDARVDVSGMDRPDQVSAAVKTLQAGAAKEPGNGIQDGVPDFELTENQQQMPCEYSCASSRAIGRFAVRANAILARKAIFSLQRLRASGIFRSEYRYKTVWDEYCHDVQFGPHWGLEEAFEDVIGSNLIYLVDKLPHEEAMLLTIAARWNLDRDEFPDDDVIWPDGMKENLEKTLYSVAMKRDISRFEVEADWT